MLKRKEIENYLFDFEVINKTFPEITRERYNSVINDCVNGEAKDHAGALKALCDPNGHMNKEEFKIHLSKHITNDMQIYKELKDCIFLDNNS